MRTPVMRVLAAGLGSTALMAGAAQAQAATQTLTTRDYVVRVTPHCAEGNVTCNRVTYRGTRRADGATIRLTGRTLARLCADGVTPCQVLGYVFRKGKVTYTVLDRGRLIVTQRGRVLLRQDGRWS